MARKPRKPQPQPENITAAASASPLSANDVESFLYPTRIWLFGKPFNSLRYVREDMAGEFENYRANFVDSKAGLTGQLRMPPGRLERTLRKQRYDDNDTAGNDPLAKRFARIYSFSYEGHFYKLPRPLLFLVHGVGKPVYETVAEGNEASRRMRSAWPTPGERPEPRDPLGRQAFLTRLSGLDVREWHFSDDLFVWKVDRKDLAVCLDVEVGNYQEILLDSMIASGGNRAAGSRGDVVSRGDMVSRGDVVSRGAGSFRGDIIGPHQNR